MRAASEAEEYPAAMRAFFSLSPAVSTIAGRSWDGSSVIRHLTYLMRYVIRVAQWLLAHKSDPFVRIH